MKRSNKILLSLAISLEALVTIFIILAISFIFLSAKKYEHYFYTRPTAQRSSVWISENGEILLRVNEKGNGTLSFKQNGTIIEYDYVDGKNYRSEIYHLTDMRTSDNHYETWKYTKVGNDKFTIEVEKTTFFEVGQQITFYRTQGDGSSGNTGDG